MKALPIPANVKADKKAIELIRVWGSEGKQCIAIQTGLWENPAAWGLVLADLARNVAAAYERDKKYSHEEALNLIRAGFDAEWDSPTD